MAEQLYKVYYMDGTTGTLTYSQLLFELQKPDQGGIIDWELLNGGDGGGGDGLGDAVFSNLGAFYSKKVG